MNWSGENPWESLLPRPSPNPVGPLSNPHPHPDPWHTGTFFNSASPCQPHHQKARQERVKHLGKPPTESSSLAGKQWSHQSIFDLCSHSVYDLFLSSSACCDSAFNLPPLARGELTLPQRPSQPPGLPPSPILSSFLISPRFLSVSCRSHIFPLPVFLHDALYPNFQFSLPLSFLFCLCFSFLLLSSVFSLPSHT